MASAREGLAFGCRYPKQKYFPPKRLFQFFSQERKTHNPDEHMIPEPVGSREEILIPDTHEREIISIFSNFESCTGCINSHRGSCEYTDSGKKVASQRTYIWEISPFSWYCPSPPLRGLFIRSFNKKRSVGRQPLSPVSGQDLHISSPFFYAR